MATAQEQLILQVRLEAQQALRTQKQVLQGFTSFVRSVKEGSGSVKEMADAYKEVATAMTRIKTTPLQRLAIEQEKTKQSANKLATEQTKLARVQENTNKSTVKMTQGYSSLQGQLASTLKQMVGVYAIVNSLKKVMTAGIDFNKFMESSTTAFGVMMKSTDLAKAKMQELFNFAVNSPLTFQETVEASKQLLAYGFAANTLTDNMEMLGIVAKATGHSLEDISYVYGTLKTQGRAYTRDLMQFAMRGIPIYDELAKVLGVPVEQVQKLTEEGKVGFAEVERAFRNMTEEGGRFGGFFVEYMKTFEGRMSMLTDVWQKVTGAVTRGLFEALGPVIDDLTQSLKNNSDAWEAWGSLLGKVASSTASSLKEWSPLGEALNNVLFAAVKLASEVNWEFIAGGVALIGVAAGSVLSGIVLLAIALKNIAGLFNKLDANFRNTALAPGALKDLTSESLRGESRAARVNASANTSTRVGNPVFNEDDYNDAAAYLEKLQQQLDRIRAQNLVDTQANIFAIAELENRLAIAEINEKLKGQEALRATALNVQAQIHQDAISKIKEKNAAEIAAIRKAELERMESDTRQFNSFIGMLGFVNKTPDTDERLSQLEAYKDSIEKSIAETDSFIQSGLDLTGTEIKEELKRKKDILAAILVAIADRQTEITKEEYEKWLKMREDYDKKIQAKQEEALKAALTGYDEMLNGSKAFFDELAKAAYKSFKAGKILEGIGAQTKLSLQGTNVGTLMSGTGDPIAMFIASLIGAAKELDGVMEVLNFIQTFTNGIISTFGPLIEAVAAPLGDLIFIIGQLVGVIFTILSPLFTETGKLLTWLNDSVLVPLTNALIDFLNSIRGATGAAKLDYIATSKEREATEELAKVLDDMSSLLESDLNDISSLIRSMVGEQVKSLRDLYEVGAISGAEYEAQSKGVWAGAKDALIAAGLSEREALEALGKTITGTAGMSLTDLYSQFSKLLSVQEQVGAIQKRISGLQGAGLAGTAFANEKQTIQALIDSLPEGYQADLEATLNGINPTAISKDEEANYINPFYASLGAAGTGALIGSIGGPVGAFIGGLIGFVTGALGATIANATSSYAVGSYNVPSDMMANIHKDEMIIDKPIASAIRSGELSLSGTRQNSGNSIQVVVNVQGSVTAENDLATTIAERIYLQKNRGYLTVRG